MHACFANVLSPRQTGVPTLTTLHTRSDDWPAVINFFASEQAVVALKQASAQCMSARLAKYLLKLDLHADVQGVTVLQRQQSQCWMH